jgi:hypothetical protein
MSFFGMMAGSLAMRRKKILTGGSGIAAISIAVLKLLIRLTINDFDVGVSALGQV